MRARGARLGDLLAPAIVLLPWLLWDALAPEERRIVPSRGPLDAFPAVWFPVVLGALAARRAEVPVRHDLRGGAYGCARPRARARSYT